MPVPTARIKAVVFDLDDTLIDWSQKSAGTAELALRHMKNVYDYLQAQGHNLPDLTEFLDQFQIILVSSWDEAKKRWHGVALQQVLWDTFRQLRLELDEIDMEAVLRVYDWQPVPGVVPYADTLPVLKALRQRRYKIGLITNSMQPMWMRDIELKAFGILDFLDARLTSGDVGHMKPHPFIYWQALERLEVAPREAVFVGDRPVNDIAGANEAGMVSVLICPPHLDYELGRVKPDYTITRLQELLPILELLESE